MLSLRTLSLVAAIVGAALVSPLAAAFSAVPPGEWIPTGSPILVGGPLIALEDGSALLLGSQVERYTPNTGDWSPAGSLQRPSLTYPTFTLLADGKVLAAGGANGSSGTAAEVYSPQTGSSVVTDSMNLARSLYQATLLSSGRVLVSGGRHLGTSLGPDEMVGPAELYDPTTGGWALTGVLNQFRSRHAAVRLANGKVLVAGGSDLSPNPLASAEIYDPATGTWSFTAAMHEPRTRATGVLLPDGRVLVAGIVLGHFSETITSEVWNPVTETWSPTLTVTSDLISSFSLVILRNGIPLLVKGGNGLPCTSFLFDPLTGFWSPAGSTANAADVNLQVATLADGRVLLVNIGGAELFRPDNSTPRLVVAPTVLPVGKTAPGSTIDVVVTLENTGETRLTGNASTTTPFTVISGSTFSLAAMTSSQVVVRFAPQGFGLFAGSIQFSSNGGWLSVSVTGEAGVMLSGRITNAEGIGLPGVTVELHGAATSTSVTDTTGLYGFVAQPSNGYTVTPTGPGLTFTPSTRSVLVGTANVSGLDFGAAVVDTIAAFVGGFYQNVLGRAPEPSGLAGWTGLIRQHCNPDGFRVIVQGFFDSQEFRSRPLTLVALVAILYRTILAREPEPSGLTGWVGTFRRTRLEMAAQGFIPSPEFQSLLPDRANRQAVTAVVTRFYTDILGRTPEPLGLSLWVDYIVSTGDLVGTAIAFLASEEFEQRALTFREYITILYEAFLGRAPEPDGLDGWESTLRARLLSVLNSGFIPSTEFQARIPVVCN